MTGNKSVQEKQQMLNGDTNLATPLWTVEDVAHYLRLEPETVRAMARSGKIPAVKIGRFWRFNKSLIEKYFLEVLYQQ